MNRFGECKPCRRSFTCTNESITLSKGFYMNWLTENDKQAFMNFTENILTYNNSYSMNKSIVHKELLPVAYACPEPSSCLGGPHSHCAKGYHGPLCAVCISRYYKLLTRCLECPSVPWLVSQMVLVAFVVSGLIFYTIKDKRNPNFHGRSSSDAFLSRLKTVVSFYQVTSATLDGFSYVEWPVEMIKLVSYAKLIQLNILQIAPVHCFKQSFQVNIYDRLLAIITLNLAIVMIAFVWYKAKTHLTSQRYDLNDTQKQELRLNEQQRCLKLTFMFLFVIYSATTSSIFQVLPLSCQKICSGSGSSNCNRYLRYDYSISCDSAKYKRYLPSFYLLLVYPLILPLATLLLLTKAFNSTWSKEQKDTVKNGLSFLYENYNSSCWFWEIVDITRKIVLTSAILLANTESRSYLLFLSVSSGLYTVLFAGYKPIENAFEYWLQMASLMASWANLMAGLLLKIPENELSVVQTKFDSVGVTVLMISTNVFVVAMVVGEY